MLLFLCSRRNEVTGRWWAALKERPQEAPAIVRELFEGRRAVSDRPEIDAALEWAREQEGWVDDPAPLYVIDSEGRTVE